MRIELVKAEAERARNAGYYTCCSCKEQEKWPPALINAAGIFCPECRDAIKAKSAERCKGLTRGDGTCLWCGAALTDKNTCGSSPNVCKRCAANVEWLRACISARPHAAKYVAQREQLEAGERDVREAKRQAALAATPAPTQKDDLAGQVADIKAQLAQLLTALGGK